MKKVGILPLQLYLLMVKNGGYIDFDNDKNAYFMYTNTGEQPPIETGKECIDIDVSLGFIEPVGGKRYDVTPKFAAALLRNEDHIKPYYGAFKRAFYESTFGLLLKPDDPGICDGQPLEEFCQNCKFFKCCFPKE